MGYDCIIIIIISQEFNPLQMHFILTSFVMLKSLLLMESTWTPGRLHMDSTRTPWMLSGVHQEFIRSPPGVYQESTRSPPGVHQDSIRNIRTPSGFHQEYLESIRTPSGLHQDVWGNVNYTGISSVEQVGTHHILMYLPVLVLTMTAKTPS